MSKRALIVAGGWEGHEPMRFAEFFAGLLRHRGVAAEIAASLDALNDAEKLRAFDLIIPNWTMGVLPPEAEKGLLAAVAGGVGCAGWHGGMGDAFRGSANFQFMVGGQFVSHPGDIKRYLVAPVAGHAITEGLAPFEMNTEQYYLHVDPSNHMLAWTIFDGLGAPWTKGTVMPVAWTRHYDQGRVFYCSLGHLFADFENPSARELTLRGLLWAAGAL